LLGICFSLSTIVLACAGEKQTTVTDTDGATTSGETQASSNATEVTGPTGAQTTEQSSSETEEATDGPTTDDTTKGDTEDPTKGSDSEDPTKGSDSEDPTKGSDTDTDTDGEQSLEKSCQFACDAFGACDPEVDLEECVAGCIEEYKEEPKECIDAVIAANMCFAMLSCEDMDPEEPPFPCEEEEMLAEAVCGGGEDCAIGVGMGMGVNECGIAYDCEFDSYAMDCLDDVCTCTINKEQVGECSSENICGQIGEGEVLDLLTSCCGFDL